MSALPDMYIYTYAKGLRAASPRAEVVHISMSSLSVPFPSPPLVCLYCWPSTQLPCPTDSDFHVCNQTL